MKIDGSSTRGRESIDVHSEAADWFLRIRGDDVSKDTLLAWIEWFDSDARNQEAFDATLRIWNAAEALRVDGKTDCLWPTASELIHDDYDGCAPVSLLPENDMAAGGKGDTPDPQDIPRRPAMSALVRRKAIFAIAASLLGAAVFGPGVADWFQGPDDFGTQRLETQFGEHRSVTLDDGSLIDLGSRSLVSVTFGPSSRSLSLERGEAYFDVVKDPARPFTVGVGSVEVTAVGTAFNVRYSGDVVKVGVAEGIVSVASSSKASLHSDDNGSSRSESNFPNGSLTAGQQVILERNSSEVRLKLVQSDHVADWRKGRLQYESETLASIMADLRRYTSREIVIGDAAAAELRVTGSVITEDVDSWIDTIDSALPLQSTLLADGTLVIESRLD